MKTCRYCKELRHPKGLYWHEKRCQKIHQGQERMQALKETLVESIKELGQTRPSYYRAGGLEAIEVMQAFHPNDMLMAGALEHVLTAGRKTDLATGIKKAIIYLQWALDREEGRPIGGRN